ncbi:hypothetical protein [Periweissella ghanensis]|uniref:Uncharacterized protein n=1 Tax=Periweissella ghanensis TaxID=467997 RepID=A0ABN8BNW5_9LACO|nr:hypothetical protein [Periweissella ghanensis]MCM0600609.1 hypothetical protein [Periweissella ghanensis]CAH0418308.1 hypothetical protein WGH24286_00726 [Periweissella ghanensis]
MENILNKLGGQIGTLTINLALKEGQLDEANQQAAQLQQQIADLTKQIEELTAPKEDK